MNGDALKAGCKFLSLLDEESQGELYGLVKDGMITLMVESNQYTRKTAQQFIDGTVAGFKSGKL